jgi:hypothetical protein
MFSHASAWEYPSGLPAKIRESLRAPGVGWQRFQPASSTLFLADFKSPHPDWPGYLKSHARQRIKSPDQIGIVLDRRFIGNPNHSKPKHIIGYAQGVPSIP